MSPTDAGFRRLDLASHCGGTDRTPLDLSDLGDRPGAYLLAMGLRAPTAVTIGGRLRGTLAPGLYAYCGSAHGPGGLAARLRRHLRAGKNPHWHIDQLTAQADIAGIAVRPGGRECDLFDLLRAMAGSSVPIPGFGSSDCRRCPAHLLKAAGRLAMPPGLLPVRVPTSYGDR